MNDKIERVKRIIDKVLKNQKTINKLKEKLGDDFETKIRNGDIDENYLSKIEDKKPGFRIEAKGAIKDDKDPINDTKKEEFQQRIEERENRVEQNLKLNDIIQKERLDKIREKHKKNDERRSIYSRIL